MSFVSLGKFLSVYLGIGALYGGWNYYMTRNHHKLQEETILSSDQIESFRRVVSLMTGLTWPLAPVIIYKYYEPGDLVSDPDEWSKEYRENLVVELIVLNQAIEIENTAENINFWLYEQEQFEKHKETGGKDFKNYKKNFMGRWSSVKHFPANEKTEMFRRRSRVDEE